MNRLSLWYDAFMRALIQRVSRAQVSVGGGLLSQIHSGALIFLGVSKSDTEKDAEWIADKIAHLRIFSDEEGKMNRSLLDSDGQILVVSQFTLYGDCTKGRRPSFGDAADPEMANKLYLRCAEVLKDLGLNVKTGQFQAHMEVELVNDGPVTFMLES